MVRDYDYSFDRDAADAAAAYYDYFGFYVYNTFYMYYRDFEQCEIWGDGYVDADGDVVHWGDERVDSDGDIVDWVDEYAHVDEWVECDVDVDGCCSQQRMASAMGEMHSISGQPD